MTRSNFGCSLLTCLAIIVLLGSSVAGQSPSSPTLISKETFQYAQRGDLQLKMDKYVAAETEVDQNKPVLIYIHGGGFSMGSRVNALLIKYCKHFAAQGFVAIAIDYRLGMKGGENDTKAVLNAVSIAVEDLFEATSFILSKADEWNIDKDRIVISGGSAGAVTCLNAEYDICTTKEHSNKLPDGFNYAAVVSHAGCLTIANDKIEWGKNPCPMMLMHGSNDAQVTFDKVSLPGLSMFGSKHIFEQLKAMDVPVWLYEEEGADHIVALKPLQHNFFEIDSFLRRIVLDRRHSIVHTKWHDKEPGSMGKLFEIVPLYVTGWEKTEEQVEADKKP